MMNLGAATVRSALIDYRSTNLLRAPRLPREGDLQFNAFRRTNASTNTDAVPQLGMPATAQGNSQALECNNECTSDMQPQHFSLPHSALQHKTTPGKGRIPIGNRTRKSKVPSRSYTGKY